MAAKGKKKKEEIEDVMMTNEAENEAKSAEDALLDEKKKRIWSSLMSQMPMAMTA